MSIQWQHQLQRLPYPAGFSEGLLFCASGLDVAINYDRDLVATTLRLEYGFGLRLHIGGGYTLLSETSPRWRCVVPTVVLTDLLVAQIGDSWAVFIAEDNGTISGRAPIWSGVGLYSASDWQGVAGRTANTDRLVRYSEDEMEVALVRRRTGDSFRFALSIEGEDRATEACEADLETAVLGRLRSYESMLSLYCPTSDAPHWEAASRLLSTALQSISVLRSTVNSPNRVSPYFWMTPDRLPHKHMWIWDTVFQAIALRLLEPNAAFDSIRSILHYQRDDGFIPHLMSPDWTSNLIQPPLLGWGLREILRSAVPPVETIAEAVEGTQQFIEWIVANRSGPNGLPGWHINREMPWCRCDESGMDNSPRFDIDDSLDCVDLACYLVHDIGCLEEIGGRYDLPIRAELRRYRSSLMRRIREEFWCEERQCFLDIRRSTGEYLPVAGAHSFLPLWVGAAGTAQARAMEHTLIDNRRFGTRMPVPSVDRLHSSYSTDYWRGCSWANYNFMVTLGLERYGMTDTARSVADRTVSEIARWCDETGGVYECYDPDGRTAPGLLPQRTNHIGTRSAPCFYGPIRTYGWTAAVFLLLCGNTQRSAILEGTDT